jgi:putative phosphoesterase
MRIGLISDVHANLPALNTVLEDMPSVDQLVHAGDVVGYGPYPEDVIEVFRDLEITTIQGNHDRIIVGDSAKGDDAVPMTVANWTAERLGDDELDYLDSLPLELNLVGSRVHVAHGAPGKPDEYTYPEDFRPELLSGEDVLILGHTHEQALSEFDEGTVVNPGSVGLPRDGDLRSGYAVLNLETMEIDLYRVEYSYEDVQKRAREFGLPEAVIDGVANGRLVPPRAQRSE